VNLNQQAQPINYGISELTKTNAGKFAISLRVPLNIGDIKTVYCMFNARNGSWSQELHFRMEEHIVKIATVIKPREFAMDDSNIIYRNEYTIPIPAPSIKGPGSASAIDTE
jgi:hypothetical protein